MSILSFAQGKMCFRGSCAGWHLQLHGAGPRPQVGVRLPFPSSELGAQLLERRNVGQPSGAQDEPGHFIEGRSDASIDLALKRGYLCFS